MDIVICTDNNYVMPSGVLICSICENNKGNRIRFHIIGDEKLTEIGKASLQEEVNRYHHSISFYNIDSSLYSFMPTGKEGQPQHITIAAYYRLFLADLLPVDIDKVLYLDCDTIVRHSLKDLWSTDITDYAVGGVTDVFEGLICHYNRLRYPQPLGYFNSGVLLINLAYWRKYKLQDLFLDYLKKYPERLKYYDQDVLNYVLREKKKTLHLKYNVQDCFLRKELFISWEYETELNDAVNDPYIIHYSGGMKPWVKECKNPFRSEFVKYLQCTKWKNTHLVWKMPLSSRIKQKVKALLVNLHILSRVQYNNYRNDISLQD